MRLFKSKDEVAFVMTKEEAKHLAWRWTVSPSSLTICEKEKALSTLLTFKELLNEL